MSTPTEPGAPAHHQDRRTHRQPLILRHAARWLVCLGLAASFAQVSTGGLAAANAAPQPAAHQVANNSGKSAGKPGHGHHVKISAIGTVASLGTGSFMLTIGSPTLTATATTDTVNVSSTTTYREPGVKPAKAADVLVGDKVRVTGVLASPGTIDATSVFIYQAKVIGTVATISTNSFTITTTQHATVTVNVSSTNTTYREPGVKSATFADVMVSDKVQVIGAQAGAGIVNAISVKISPSAHASKGGHGHK